MRKVWCALVLSCFFNAIPIAAATVIKIGCIAPVGSPWDVALKRISADWNSISGGKVVLKVYSGGTAGDEPDMIRKVRMGQIDGIGVSGVGLILMDPAIMSFHIPLLMRTDAEADYIFSAVQPTFEANLKKEGYTVMFWSRVGWLHFFSKKPVVTPNDLKKNRLFVWGASIDEEKSWKENGFNPITMPATEMMTALQSGMIEAFTTSPLVAASFQWFGLAPNMCEMNWTPFIGALVVSNRIWQSIPEDLATQLRASAKKNGAAMQSEIAETEAKAISIMLENGLKINAVPPEVVEQWAAIVEKGFLPKFSRKSYDPDLYEKIRNMLKDYRANNK
ncbi:MAG: TRAP transporter substrate-binding protein DctP [Chitinispirillaceae bacterium]|nr:TRAP transporter substrate-binding protein DctP [Chitinispirillaceae bacterium]